MLGAKERGCNRLSPKMVLCDLNCNLENMVWTMCQVPDTVPRLVDTFWA